MSAATSHATPYPGFRPFRPEEAEWFFGRDEAAFELAERLGDTSFVAVMGASGSGKSSLVECGLRPLLDRGLVGDAGARWRVVRMRPLNDPIGELAESLSDPDLFDWPSGPIPPEQLVEGMLRRSSRGLLDVADRARLHPRENLLIFVDQFEELFRYTSKIAKPGGTRDDITFVELLLRAAQATRDSIEAYRAEVSDTHRQTREAGQPAKIYAPPQLANRVFVILTMRSDYLGACTRYQNLTRWVNDGFYLVPFLDRPELRQVIEGPARAFVDEACPNGVEFEERLVNRILNDVGDETSLLPVLQHVLMRMWNAREPGTAKLGLADYESVGGLENALDAHLGDIFEWGLADEPGAVRAGRQDIARRVFQRLTEIDAENRPGRRTATVKELCTLVGVPEEASVPDPSEGGFQPSREDVEKVLDAFRQTGRTFLSPPPPAMRRAAAASGDGDAFERPSSAYGETLRDDLPIDISHESLIWSWTTLRDEWLPDDMRDREIYGALSVAAQEWVARKKPWWSANWYPQPKLGLALEWAARAGIKRGWKRPASVAEWAKPQDERVLRLPAFRGAAVAEGPGSDGASSSQTRPGVGPRPRPFDETVEFLKLSRRNWIWGFVLAAVSAASVLAVAADFYVDRREAELQRQRVERILFAAETARTDPLTAALVLAELGEEENVDSLTARAGLDLAGQATPFFVFDPPGRVRGLAFDGQRLLVVADSAPRKTVYLFNLENRVRYTFSDAAIVTASLLDSTPTVILTSAVDDLPAAWESVVIPAGFETLTFSDDATKLLALYGPNGGDGSPENSVCVWELAAGERDSRWCRPHDDILGAVFSASGEQVVSWSQRKVDTPATIRVWAVDLDPANSASGAQHDATPPIVSLTIEPEPGMVGQINVRYAAYHERWLVTAEGLPDTARSNRARVWDLSLGRPEPCLNLPDQAPITRVALSPAGRLVTASASRVRSWDLSNADCTTRRDPTWTAELFGSLVGSTLGSEGEFLSTSSPDRRARLWQVDGPRQDSAVTSGGDPLMELKGHSGGVRRAAFSGVDGNPFATVDGANTVRVWAREPIRTFERIEELPEFARIAVNDGGTRVAVADVLISMTIDVRDIASRDIVLGADSIEGTLTAFDWQGPSLAYTARLAAGGSVLNVRNVETDSSVRVEHAAEIEDLYLADDGLVIATLAGNTVRVTGAADGETVQRFETDGAPRQVAITSDGFVAVGKAATSGDYSGTVEVWELGEDARRVVVDTIPFPGEGRAAIRDLAFSPDGRSLAIGTDQFTLVIRLAEQADSWRSGSTVIQPQIGEAASSVDFLDNTRVITSQANKPSLTIWDGSTGARLSLLKADNPILYWSAAGTGGRALAVTELGLAGSWRLGSVKSVVTSIRAATNACLRQDQRRRLLGETPRKARQMERDCVEEFRSWVVGDQVERESLQ